MKHERARLFLSVICLLFTAFLFCAKAEGESSADEDWQAVLELDAGPKETMSSRAEALKTGLEFLSKQEAALRRFLTAHPKDERAVDGELRLAHLLATSGDLTGKTEPFNAAMKLLDDSFKIAPEPRKADIAFAKIALAMHRVAVPTDEDRSELTARMVQFQHDYPNDRRLGALIAEIATLYDEQPLHKILLLKQAMQAARTDELRSRISDDLRRTALLGQVVQVMGKTVDGAPFELAQSRGKVSLVYFFATWSPPSVAGMQEVDYLRQTFKPEQLAVAGVSLDSKKERLEVLMKSRTGPGTAWPVLWDGQGWESPMIRAFGINSLPTLWIIDKKGKLRTLNARTESEALIRRLLE